MTEPLKCMDHLDCDEGDFLCHLPVMHGGPHVFADETEEETEIIADKATGKISTRTTFRVEWTKELFKPITQKEG